MSGLSIPGSLLGAVAGTGLLLLAGSVHVVRQWERVLQISGLPSIHRVQPSALHVFRRFSRRLLFSMPHSPWLSDHAIENELRRAFRQETLMNFRRTQILYASAGASMGLFWCVLRGLSGHQLNPLFIVSVVSVLIVCGGWFARWDLRRESTRRMMRIEQELPVVVDLLAFAVSAGEPVVVALRRICQMCTGEFVHELFRINALLSAGVSLTEAMSDMDRVLHIPAVSRLVRAITIALERGTPMAEVLRAQASDSRAEASRTLLAIAGKKETAMMIPVVFLILPLIVAVALYPGLIALNILHG